MLSLKSEEITEIASLVGFLVKSSIMPSKIIQEQEVKIKKEISLNKIRPQNRWKLHEPDESGTTNLSYCVVCSSSFSWPIVKVNLYNVRSNSQGQFDNYEGLIKGFLNVSYRTGQQRG